MTHDGHITGIATKGGYVSLDPSQGFDLVEQAQIATARIVFTVRQQREVQKAEQSQSIVDGHKYDLGVSLDKAVAPVAGTGRAVAHVGATMNPHHNGAARTAHTSSSRPHVECQAVLALGIERGGIALAARLDRTVAKVFSLPHQPTVRLGLSNLPSTLTRGLDGIGDALEGEQRTVALTNEDTIGYLHSQRVRVIPLNDFIHAI